MEASAWLLLISIAVLAVAIFFHRRQGQFRGIGLFGTSCPRCAAPLPSVRKATSIRESLWGRMDVRELRLQDRQNTVGRGIGNKVKRKPTRG
jgi:hypothetical protein